MGSILLISRQSATEVNKTVYYGIEHLDMNELTRALQRKHTL